MNSRKRLAVIARAAKKAVPRPAAARLRQLGTTWWGHRWIDALERGSRDVVARLGRGRAYARAGNVHDLQIRTGVITATVTDDDLESFAVSLRLETFDDAVWQQAIDAMNGQALFAAQLLNGEMPREIDQLFRQCGKSLFPTNPHDIDADCSCDDWAGPCKHVAATHYVLGEALDTDPFLLFTLRGRGKDQVLGTLDHLRAPASLLQSAPAPTKTSPVATRGVLLSELDATRYESWQGAPPVLRFQFDTVLAPGALLNSLGKPALWEGNASPRDLLEPLLHAARDCALSWATGVPEGVAQAAAQSGARRRARRKDSQSY